jgi:hypothetical protein
MRKKNAATIALAALTVGGAPSNCGNGKGYEFQYHPSTILLAELAECLVTGASVAPSSIFILTWNAKAACSVCN